MTRRVQDFQDRTADDASGGRFALNVTFDAPGYAQLMQGRLLVFKPAIVSRRDSLSLTDPNRQHPVVLRLIPL